MRRIVAVLGFAVAMLAASTITATAAPAAPLACCWRGPFASEAQCQEDLDYYRENIGPAGNCNYREVTSLAWWYRVPYTDPSPA